MQNHFMTFMYTLLLTEFSEVGIFSQAGAKSCLGALFVAILNHGHCRAEKKKNNDFNLPVLSGEKKTKNN